MRTTTPLLRLFLLLLAPLLVAAQFGNFFENMFQGSQGGGRRPQNVASDSNWYQATYSGAQCDKYLCPGTLSCVDKATHCPCAWPDHEEKFELDPDALAVCATKGKKTKRKVELARKGLL